MTVAVMMRAVAAMHGVGGGGITEGRHNGTEVFSKELKCLL